MRKLAPTPSYFTLPNLVKFLEGYQPQGEYPYDSDHACMVVHFMFAHEGEDAPEPLIANKKESRASADSGRTWFKIPAVFQGIAKEAPHTYPAALERAKVALASEAELV